MLQAAVAAGIGLLADQPDQAEAGQVGAERLGPQSRAGTWRVIGPLPLRRSRASRRSAPPFPGRPARTARTGRAAPVRHGSRNALRPGRTGQDRRSVPPQAGRTAAGPVPDVVLVQAEHPVLIGLAGITYLDPEPAMVRQHQVPGQALRSRRPAGAAAARRSAAARPAHAGTTRHPSEPQPPVAAGLGPRPTRRRSPPRRSGVASAHSASCQTWCALPASCK